MSCRNPNVYNCMASQSYLKTFSNVNSNDSGYWSDYQETPKNYGKTITRPNLCAIHVTHTVKKWAFFFKTEWTFNLFQGNFKSNYVQISFFPIALCFSVKNTQKCTSLKLYLKNRFNVSLPNLHWSIEPKSRMKIVANEKNKSPSTPVKKLKCPRLENCFKITNKFLQTSKFIFMSRR